MATVLTTNLSVVLDTLYQSTLDLSTSNDAMKVEQTEYLTDGTTANKADVIWHDTRSLNATSSEDLDMAGSLTDAFGNTVTFVDVKGIFIRNKTTTSTYELAVGGASSNQFINWVGDSSDIVNIGAGGCLLLTAPVDGWAVTASTGDLLKINNANAGAVSYDIVIWGTTA